MTEDQVHIPPTAYLPEPKPATETPPPTNGNGEEQNVIEQAALMYNRFKIEREQSQTTIIELTLKAAALKRENDALLLERAELKNNMLTLVAENDELRQESAELRALQGEQHSLALHMASRYANYNIPPKTKRRNGNVKT